MVVTQVATIAHVCHEGGVKLLEGVGTSTVAWPPIGPASPLCANPSAPFAPPIRPPGGSTGPVATRPDLTRPDPARPASLRFSSPSCLLRLRLRVRLLQLLALPSSVGDGQQGSVSHLIGYLNLHKFAQKHGFYSSSYSEFWCSVELAWS